MATTELWAWKRADGKVLSSGHEPDEMAWLLMHWILLNQVHWTVVTTEPDRLVIRDRTGKALTIFRQR